MSIQDVAKRAGVSTATVSLIINGKARASRETVEAVRKAMAELNYVPRPRNRRPGRKATCGKGLRTGRIGIVFLETLPHQLRAPFHADLLSGMQQALYEQDMVLVLSSVPPGAPVPTDLRDGGIDGAIVVNASYCERSAQGLAPLPIVSVLGPPVGWCDCVTVDNEGAGRLAASFLLGTGHTRCAAITDLSHAALLQRCAIFEKEIIARGGTALVLRGDDLHLVTAQRHEGNREKLRVLLDQLLTAEPQPSALFVPADMLTATVYTLLHERGIRPQCDVCVLSCNNEKPILGALYPRPPVVDLHADIIGKRAVELLLHRIRRPDEPTSTLLVTPSLLDSGGATIDTTSCGREAGAA